MKIELIVSVTFFIIELNAMQLSDAQKTICLEMKNLDTSKEENLPHFFEYAKKLKDNELTVSDCVKVLMKAKKERAKQALSKELNLKEDFWLEFKEKVKQYKEADKQRLAQTKELKVVYNFDIFGEIGKQVMDLIGEYQLKTDIYIYEDEKKEARNYRDFHKEANVLKINSQMNPEVVPASIRHELTHMRRYDFVKRKLIRELLFEGDADRMEKSAACLKYSRYCESYADRAFVFYKPTFEVAKDSVLFHDDNFKRLQVFMPNHKIDYPSFKNRLEWAGRIAVLIYAQEELQKKQNYWYPFFKYFRFFNFLGK